MSKKYLGIICLFYSGIISYVIFFDKLKNFLAPQMQIYIKCSLPLLIIIGIVLLLDKNNHYKFKISDLILLLPLLILIFAGDGRLTSSLASNRSTIKKNKEVVEKKEDNNYTELPSEKIDNIDFEVIDSTFSYLATYLSFADNASEQAGKTIKIKGFVTKDSSINPKGYFSLGRYEISCCTADASFLGFLINDNHYNIEENKWYEIQGTLKLVPTNAQRVILSVEPSYIKSIDKNKEEQYVYPCYSYDSTCKDAQKYNLKY
jgi:uncharacterized repeat protein (TIGR03943 family)